MAEPDKPKPGKLVIEVGILLKGLADKQRLLVQFGGCLHPVKKIQLTRDAGGRVLAYIFRIN